MYKYMEIITVFIMSKDSSNEKYWNKANEIWLKTILPIRKDCSNKSTETSSWEEEQTECMHRNPYFLKILKIQYNLYIPVCVLF